VARVDIGAGGTLYCLTDYVWMLADDERIRAYAAAIRRIVKPGDRVLEIGTGVGFFSVVAVNAGAARVDAVDTTPAAHLGPHVAAANGCADRIVFSRVDSRHLALEAPADVIIADLRGPLPFCGPSLETLIDARTRLLRPGGTIVAASDTLYAAPCAAPDVWRREVAAGLGRNEVRLDPIVPQIYDTPFRCRIESEALRAAPARWLELDYLSVRDTDHVGSAAWTFASDEAVDGVALWFDSDLGRGERLSAAPSARSIVYRQLYLPFRKSIRVRRGASLRTEISVRLIGVNYLWKWETFVRQPGEIADTLATSQTSLAELVVHPAAMPRTGPEATPKFGAAARALAFLIEQADGTRTVAEISTAIAHTFPAEFSNLDAASSFVRSCVSRLANPSFPVE
jgi:predicted RNA methylase